jgi:hypothetical protein
MRVDVLTYLKEQLRVAVANNGSRIAVMSEGLHSLLKIVKLFREIECANQHFVPATALVRERGETLGSNPLKEPDIRDYIMVYKVSVCLTCNSFIGDAYRHRCFGTRQHQARSCFSF